MARKFLFFALLFEIIILPLPFASARAWASGLMVTYTGLLLLLWIVFYFLSQTSIDRPPFSSALLALFLIAVVWALFQLSPYSPISWHHPLWIDAATGTGQSVTGAIALDPDNALASLLKIVSYCAIFWLSAQCAGNAVNARKLVVAISIASTLYAIYGLAEYFSGSNTILFYKKEAYLDDLTATFVNRNNYATYAGLGWVCTLSLLYDDYRSWMKRQNAPSERVRDTLLFFEKKGWLPILSIFILVGALFYSHSRAGLASSVVGVIALCAALALNEKADKKLIRRFGAVCMVLAVIFFVLSGKIVDARIATTDLASEDRVQVYKLSLMAILNQPFLGSGLGSFEELFRFYRTPDIHQTFDFAHNSYLETAIELGLPATTAILAALLILVGCNLYGARKRRRDSIYPCLGFAVSILVGVHSLVDFSIQIPAIAATYSALLGIAYAQSWSSRSDAR